MVLFFFFFYNFVLVLIDWISHHAHQSTHSPPPLMVTFHPCNLPCQQKKKKNLVVEDVICCIPQSHNILFCLCFLACKCSLHWVLGLVQGCYTTNTGTSLGLFIYPVVVLCNGDPVVLDLYDQPLHSSSSSMGYVWKCTNSKPWIWAWEVWARQPTSPPTLPG